MAKFEPTEQQKEAIKAKGNVLVAAAAGSGKTAVLVERVLKLITDNNNPINADELLIVTFTNAAAAEMRARIEKRLSKQCEEEPENIRLLEQKYLLNSAKICTIDSFCIDLVRENFELAGINPDFRIVDDVTLKPLQDAAMNETINKYFSEQRETFKQLLDICGTDFDDENFRKYVNEIFLNSRNIPFPDNYLDSLLRYSELEFNSEHPWFISSMKNVKEILASMLKSCKTALDLVSSYTKYTGPYVGALEEISIQLNEMIQLAQNNCWDMLYDRINRYDHRPLNGSRDSGIPDLIAVKTIISQIGKTNGKNALLNCIFNDSDTINNINNTLKAPIKMLVDFVKDYADLLYEMQIADNSFTFYNTEQLALSMLCELQDGEIEIKDSAKPFLNRFKEVLVDEYQDTNDLQDMLFKVLSNREEHLFAVGDVKQSIYAFRGANPANFLYKKNIAVDSTIAKMGQPKKIVLANNFRSRQGVCDYINYLFSLLMRENNGDIVYNEEEMLIPTNKFPSSDLPNASLLVIDDNTASKNVSENEDDDAENDSALVVEAKVIASHIKKIMASGDCLSKDKESLRPAEFGDFAILMRNQKNRSALLAEELRKQGIPVSYSKENFLETTEIQTFCALLEVINNPKQDIPLLTVMMSPIFAFSAEEMANIRLLSPKVDLISAVTASANSGNQKVISFLNSLADMRNDEMAMPLPRFISKLLIKSDYLNIASAMKDGARRRANLLLLAEYAAGYNEGNLGSLNGFLRYLKRLPQGSLKAAKTAGGENCVQIMSMHASKGLQFPICIICDLGVDMHKKSTRTNLRFGSDGGVGLRYFDEKTNETVTSPAFNVLSTKARKERLAEELRLLYVALTRAEEQLVIISYNKSLDKKLTDKASMLLTSDCTIDRKIYESVSSMNDWVVLTSLLHKDGQELRKRGGIPLNAVIDESNLNIEIISPSDLLTSEQLADVSVKFEVDENIISKLKENYSFNYKYAPLIEIEAKSTVSRLANSAESEKFTFRAKPSFMEESGISAAGRGTATHKVMQFIDFDRNVDVDKEIERLVEWQFITESEANAVDRKALKHFFGSTLYDRILNSNSYNREMRFLTEISASKLNSELDEELSKEKIVVQGAVDLCFEENGEIVVLDFKTDRVSDTESLKEAYGEQLDFYAKACEKIFERKIKEKIIYSFALSKEITV